MSNTVIRSSQKALEIDMSLRAQKLALREALNTSEEARGVARRGRVCLTCLAGAAVMATLLGTGALS